MNDWKHFKELWHCIIFSFYHKKQINRGQIHCNPPNKYMHVQCLCVWTLMTESSLLWKINTCNNMLYKAYFLTINVTVLNLHITIRCVAVTLDPHAHTVAYVSTNCMFSFKFSCKLTLIEFFHHKRLVLIIQTYRPWTPRRFTGKSRSLDDRDYIKY